MSINDNTKMKNKKTPDSENLWDQSASSSTEQSEEELDDEGKAFYGFFLYFSKFVRSWRNKNQLICRIQFYK